MPPPISPTHHNLMTSTSHGPLPPHRMLKPPGSECTIGKFSDCNLSHGRFPLLVGKYVNSLMLLVLSYFKPEDESENESLDESENEDSH